MRHRGFTLIELLLTVAIIGIAAGIVTLSVRGSEMRKLTEEGRGPFSNEAAGDLCYYAPWGNLAFFHSGYKYSSGLIRLGRLDEGS